MTEEQLAEHELQSTLFDLSKHGTPSERLLATWLLKTRAVNHQLKTQLDELRKAKR
jgi:hypothetical protein